MAQNKSRVQPASIESTGIDQVREILIGETVREYDEKFHLFKEQVESDQKKIRREILDRLNSLNEFSKNELKQMNHLVEGLQESFEALRLHSDQRAAELAKETARMSTEIRTLLLEVNGKLSAEFHDLHEDFVQETRKAITQLQNQKIDRVLCAEAFGDWSQKLKVGEVAEHGERQHQ